MTACLWALLLSQSAAAQDGGARTWTLDALRSWLYVVVYYDPDRFTPITAHDHVVKATTFDGAVTWDPAQPGACNIKISFAPSALVIDPPGAREREKLDPEGAVDDGAKKTISNNMFSKGNLNFPAVGTITFQSTTCAAGANGKTDVTGDLSIRGLAKRVTVPMAISATETAFSAKGTFTMNHSDFGMSPFTLGPMTPKNKEALKFVVDVVGR